MLEHLNSLDTKLFWFINSHHCAVCDWIMWGASQMWSWIAVMIIVYILLLVRGDWRRWWMILLGILLCFLLSDKISVIAFKDVVQRLRPCHALEGVTMFRTHCGGLYGFVSSHAANAFAQATFLGLVAYSFKHLDQQRYGKESLFPTLMPCLLFDWAILVGYSRPYLGKHYPGDVICGAILGIAIGALVYFLYCKVLYWTRKKSKKDKIMV